MNYITVIFLLLTLLFVWRKDKCLIHPIIVTSSVWLFLLIGYVVIDHGLYPLSDMFYTAFLAWIVPFQIMCCTVVILVNNDRHLLHPATPLITSRYVIAFVAVCTVIAILLNYRWAMGFDPTSNILSVMKTLTVAVGREEESQPSVWLRLFSIVSQIGYVMVLIYCMKGIRFKYKFLFVLLAWVWVLMSSNKGAVLRFIMGYIGVLVFAKKLNLRVLLTSIVFICPLVIVMQIVRDNVVELDISRLIYIYLFSPLTAFDQYILHSSMDFTVYFDGEFVFKDFPFLGDLFSDNYKRANVNFFNYEVVYVPLPTNVYTMMSGYWVGWKWIGLIVGGGLHGCFWGYIYKRAKKAEVYKLFYASILHVLVFQFFHEFLLGSMRYNLLIFIYLFFLFYNPMFRRVNIR